MSTRTPIEWEGDLAKDGRIDGTIGGLRVASIVPKDGYLQVATTNGLQFAAERTKGVKTAKLLADERFRDFLLVVGARFYTDEEYVVVRALVENMLRKRRGEPSGDEVMWHRIAELWTAQRADNLATLDVITNRVALLREDITRHVEAHDERTNQVG